MSYRTTLAACLALSLAAGCNDDTPDRAADAAADPDASLDVASEPDIGPDPLDAFFEALRLSSEAFDYAAGDWDDDYGDANFYGLAFYVRLGVERDDADYLARAAEVRDRNVARLERAADDTEWFLANLEEVLMSALGLIEYAAATGDLAFVAALDAFIDRADTFVRALGDYVDVSVGNFAADTYGPTAITGGLALLDLQYAHYLDTERRDERLNRAAEIVTAIDANAWDGEGRRYRIRPDDDELELYPNIIMLLVLCRLHELTDEAAYLERAEQVFEGIEPLRHELGFYRSPYSADEMGAETDEYSTLSSQNYLALGLLLLYQRSGDAGYLERATDVLTFLRTHLHDEAQGRLLHHWIDGHIAQPGDPSYFCSGCNLQFLYVVWYLREVVGA